MFVEAREMGRAPGYVVGSSGMFRTIVDGAIRGGKSIVDAIGRSDGARCPVRAGSGNLFDGSRASRSPVIGAS
jgi:hypothetical protein